MPIVYVEMYAHTGICMGSVEEFTAMVTATTFPTAKVKSI